LNITYKANFLKSFLIPLIFFSRCLSFAGAQEDLSAQDQTHSPTSSEVNSSRTQSPQWSFNPSASRVESVLVALKLHGSRRSSRITINDFDILITEDGHRLIPLLRLLRVLLAKGHIVENTLTFTVDSGHESTIDLLAKTYQAEDYRGTLEIRIAVSDVTNKGEIYVSEDILINAFGFEYQWDENYFEYILTIKEDLEIFKRRRPKSKSAFSVKVKEVFESLDETELPKYPPESKPLLPFIETTTRLNANLNIREKSKDYDYLFAPTLTAWGHLLGGDYKIKFRNNLQYPDTHFPKFPSWLDRVLWTTHESNRIVRLGDTNVGFSDLVGPSVELFGGSFKWISQEEIGKNDHRQFLKSRKPTFKSLETVKGYAELGSTVELWINNRLIDSKVVTEIYDAPPGDGTYLFEDISLLNMSENEIKIVEIREDGIIEEYYKRIVGSNQLMLKGQWSIVGGTGTNRQEVDEMIKTEGSFSGMQIYNGLTDDLTFGVSVALTKDFAVPENTSGGSSRLSNSYHVAHQTIWRLFDQLLFTNDMGLSFFKNNDSAKAMLMGLEYPRKHSQYIAKFFSYDLDYSDGRTTISDKQGYNLSGRWQFPNDWILSIGWLHIYNNLNGDLARTSKEYLLNNNLIIPNLLPRSDLWFQLGYSDRVDSVGKTTEGIVYTMGIDGQWTKKFNINGRYSFGDNITLSSSDGLKSGLALNLGDLYTFGTRLQANYKLNHMHSFSTLYWKSNAQDQIEMTSRYVSPINSRWNSRFVVGNKLNISKFYLREYLEFKLNPRGTHRWGIKLKYDENRDDFYAGLYYTSKDLFGITKDGMTHIASRSIRPEQGGIQGFVYLDINGDGHRNEGELGVGKISILVDGRQSMKSNNDGTFYISRKSRKDSVDVSIDMGSLSAVYTPTQGLQKAFWEEGSFTEVNLGLIIHSSISGYVQAIEEDGQLRKFSGARVILKPQGKETLIKESFTAGDGSYYLGEIKPGKYNISLDEKSFPPEYRQRQRLTNITIDSREKTVDIKGYNVDIYLHTAEQESIERKKQEELEALASLKTQDAIEMVEEDDQLGQKLNKQNAQPQQKEKQDAQNEEPLRIEIAKANIEKATDIQTIQDSEKETEQQPKTLIEEMNEFTSHRDMLKQRIDAMRDERQLLLAKINDLNKKLDE